MKVLRPLCEEHPSYPNVLKSRWKKLTITCGVVLFARNNIIIMNKNDNKMDAEKQHNQDIAKQLCDNHAIFANTIERYTAHFDDGKFYHHGSWFIMLKSLLATRKNLYLGGNYHYIENDPDIDISDILKWDNPLVISVYLAEKFNSLCKKYGDNNRLDWNKEIEVDDKEYIAFHFSEVMQAKGKSKYKYPTEYV